MIRPKKKNRAFSLVEVVLALGITVFAVFSLIGLILTVAKQSADSRERQQAATIVEMICSTRRAAPLADFSSSSSPQPGFPLPALTASANNFSSSTNYFLTENGILTSSPTEARFGFLYAIKAPPNYVPSSNPGISTAYLCLFWPAQASPTNGATGHFDLTTTFALP